MPGVVVLNRASKRLWIDFFHRSADTVAKKPSSLIRDFQITLNLVCAHAFLGFAHKIDRSKPLPERQMGYRETLCPLSR